MAVTVGLRRLAVVTLCDMTPLLGILMYGVKHKASISGSLGFRRLSEGGIEKVLWLFDNLKEKQGLLESY